MPLWTPLCGWAAPGSITTALANDLLRNMSLGDFVVCGHHGARLHTPGGCGPTRLGHTAQPAAPGEQACAAGRGSGERSPLAWLTFLERLVYSISRAGEVHSEREGPGPPRAALGPPRDAVGVHALTAQAHLTAFFFFPTDGNYTAHCKSLSRKAVHVGRPGGHRRPAAVPESRLSVVPLHADAEVVSGRGSS